MTASPLLMSASGRADYVSSMAFSSQVLASIQDNVTLKSSFFFGDISGDRVTESDDVRITENGDARITAAIPIFNVSITESYSPFAGSLFTNDNDGWRPVVPYVKIDGVWTVVSRSYVNDNGVWKRTI